MKEKLLRRIQLIVEQILGLIFTKSALGSIVITKKSAKRNAWFSYNIQFQSIIENLDIDLLLDVGANEGQFVQQIRKYYQGDVYSFEPIPSVFKKLSDVALTDDKWHVFNYALGSIDGEQEINVSEMTVFSSLHETSNYSQDFFGKNSNSTQKQRIKMQRLDHALQEIIGDDSDKRIFLKMDTQGHDLEVFKGLGKFSKNVRALQSELSVIPIYEDIPHWTESIAKYEEAGFTVAGMFPVNRDSLKVIEYDCVFMRNE